MLVPESERLDNTGLDLAEIERARLAASCALRSALEVWYVVPVDSADIADEETRALIESHGIALALADLTRGFSGGTESDRISARDAREWLSLVAAGSVKLPLERRAYNDDDAPRKFVGVQGLPVTRPLSPWS